MSPVSTVGQVLEGIQAAKAGAPAFRTNFFPAQSKLQGWIEHGELLEERRDQLVFFLRKDRDFWHLYFCAPDLATLQREITALPVLRADRVTVDLVGSEPDLDGLANVVEPAGFQRHARLLRLARPGGPAERQATADGPEVRCADKSDCQAILKLLECSFDRYADQLPMLYEVEAAVAGRQVLAVKYEGTVAGLLFYETQGFTSTVRYWVVDQRFKSHRFGSALMRQYLAAQGAVRRFILWVTADNENALLKYRHYGYAPDGLIDHVLANKFIRS